MSVFQEGKAASPSARAGQAELLAATPSSNPSSTATVHCQDSVANSDIVSYITCWELCHFAEQWRGASLSRRTTSAAAANLNAPRNNLSDDGLSAWSLKQDTLAEHFSHELASPLSLHLPSSHNNLPLSDLSLRHGYWCPAEPARVARGLSFSHQRSRPRRRRLCPRPCRLRRPACRSRGQSHPASSC